MQITNGLYHHSSKISTRNKLIKTTSKVGIKQREQHSVLRLLQNITLI